MSAWKPTDEQIEALAKHWINDWDTRADEHEDWIADFHDLIASDAGQSIIRAAQAEALREASNALGREGVSLKPGGWGSNEADVQTAEFAIACQLWLAKRAARFEAQS